MRTPSPRIASLFVVGALLTFGADAGAQFRLRADAFGALPLANWQASRYSVGGGLAVGVEWAFAPAIGLTASVGWTGLASDFNGSPLGQSIPALSTGGYAWLDLGLRLRPTGYAASGAERLWVEADVGLARTGEVFAPAVRARLGWSFAAGPVDLGPWVGWAWLPQTDAEAYPGDAHLALIGVELTLFPHRPTSPASTPPVLAPTPPAPTPPACTEITGPSLPDVDGDGCAESDRDGDRVRDAVDRCPEVAEDRDGFQDDDGCPDPDNDGDEILDPVDRCPDQPEVVNGVEDQDGCPDQGVVEVREGRIVVAEQVFFDSDSYRIRERSREVLDAIAVILRERSARRVAHVEGHADQRGDDRYNFLLSFMRALAVQQQLVARGIPAARLMPLGFGRRVPRITGDSREALAANRRVEIVVSGNGSAGDAQTVGGWLRFDDAGRSERVRGPRP